jgi:hypothetical protein
LAWLLVHQLEGRRSAIPLDSSPLPAALPSPLQIRPFEAADWPSVWALLEPVFRAGSLVRTTAELRIHLQTPG